jgi:hypothetical protein
MSSSDFCCRACKRWSNTMAMTILTAALASAGPAAAQTATPTPAQPSAPAVAPAAKPAAPAQPNCPAQPEMTFTTWSNPLGQSFGEGSRDYIFADGFICSDTAQKFQQFLTAHPPKPDTTVVLNSGGGDLEAGMDMGALIRQRKLWTEVGSFFPLIIPNSPNIKPQSVPYLSEPAMPPFPGGCYSACNFVFMGGVRRTMNYGSNFGVHQFESDPNANIPNLQEITEQMSAAIVKFLTVMGISPSWIVYMAQKRGNDVTDLTMTQMQELNVVTPRWQTQWQIAPLANGSGFSLQGTTTDAWGTDSVVFACAPQTSPSPATVTSSQQQPSLIATFSLDPGVRAKAQDLIGAVAGYSIELSGDTEPISLTAKQAPPAQVIGNRLVLTLLSITKSSPHWSNPACPIAA